MITSETLVELFLGLMTLLAHCSGHTTMDSSFRKERRKAYNNKLMHIMRNLL